MDSQAGEPPLTVTSQATTETSPSARPTMATVKVPVLATAATARTGLLSLSRATAATPPGHHTMATVVPAAPTTPPTLKILLQTTLTRSDAIPLAMVVTLLLLAVPATAPPALQCLG